jgi:hypothetical protein
MNFGIAIRVENLSQPERDELEERRRKLSFEAREKRQTQKGRIVARHGYLYDVLIPGREYPYTLVPPTEPVKLKVGSTVTLGFVEDNPGIPFILAFRKRRSVRQLTELLPVEGALWTHFLQNGGRKGRTTWTPIQLQNFRSMSDFYAPGAERLVRVWGAKIYADIFGGILAFMEAGGQYFGFDYPFYFCAGAPIDMVLDEGEDGVMYVLAGSGGGAGIIEKIDPVTQTQILAAALGSGSVSTGTANYRPIRTSLFLSPTFTPEGGEEEDAFPPTFGCLSSKPHEATGQPTLHLHVFDRSSGDSVSLQRIEQGPPPEFATGERYPLVSSPESAGGAVGWRRFELWSPSLLGGDPIVDEAGLPYYDMKIRPEYLDGRNTTQAGRILSPFARIGEGWSNIGLGIPPVFPRDPVNWTSTSSRDLYWGIEGEDFADPPILTLPTDCTGIIQCTPSIVIPACTVTPGMVAHKVDGSRAWEVKGWEQADDEGGGAGAIQTRDFYSPLLAHNGRLAVITRRARFLTIDITEIQATSTFEDFFDTSILLTSGHPYYGTRSYPAGFVEGETMRARVLISVEDRLEIFTATTGEKTASQPLTAVKITSKAHYPGANLGTETGAYWTYLLDDTFIFPYTGPTYLDLYGPVGPQPPIEPYEQGRTDYYTQPWLLPFSRKIASGNYNPETTRRSTFSAGARGANPSWFVFSSGEMAVAGPSGWSLRREAIEFETSADAPLLFDKARACVSTSGSLLIFGPVDTIPAPALDEGGDILLAGARRDFGTAGVIANDEEDNPIASWSGGNFANGYRHNVTLGGPYNNSRRWVEARSLTTGEVAWRHEIPVAAAPKFSHPCCGGGRLYLHYVVSGVHRLRVVDDTDGSLIGDSAVTLESGSGPNDPRFVILCGDVALAVTDGIILSILPES